MPLNLQWPLLTKGGANFHHFRFADSIYSKNVLGLYNLALAATAGWLERWQIFRGVPCKIFTQWLLFFLDLAAHYCEF